MLVPEESYLKRGNPGYYEVSDYTFRMYSVNGVGMEDKRIRKLDEAVHQGITKSLVPYVAFYGSVLHEVEEVEVGRRLTLSYVLRRVGDALRSPVKVHSPNSSIPNSSAAQVSKIMIKNSYCLLTDRQTDRQTQITKYQC